MAQLHEAKVEEKKAKKEREAAARKVKADAKKAEADAKKAAKKAETDAKKTGAKRQRTEGPQKDDSADISKYEKNRNATKQANGAYLEFLDKVSEKECKILDKGGDTISNMNLGGFTPDM